MVFERTALCLKKKIKLTIDKHGFVLYIINRLKNNPNRRSNNA